MSTTPLMPKVTRNQNNDSDPSNSLVLSVKQHAALCIDDIEVSTFESLVKHGEIKTCEELKGFVSLPAFFDIATKHFNISYGQALKLLAWNSENAKLVLSATKGELDKSELLLKEAGETDPAPKRLLNKMETSVSNPPAAGNKRKKGKTGIIEKRGIILAFATMFQRGKEGSQMKLKDMTREIFKDDAEL